MSTSCTYHRLHSFLYPRNLRYNRQIFNFIWLEVFHASLKSHRSVMGTFLLSYKLVTFITLYKSYFFIQVEAKKA